MLRVFRLLGAAAVLALVGGANPTIAEDEGVTVRYSVKATIEVGGKTRAGRTVLESRFWFKDSGGGSFLAADVHGEAIPIAVEGLGTVFVLRRYGGSLSETSAGAWILYCTPPDLPDLDLIAITTFPACDPSQVRKPMLALLRDNTSVEFLPYADKGGTANLVSLQVAVTDEPVTRGLDRTHRWISLLPSMLLPDGGTQAAAGVLYREDFSR